MNEYYAIVNSEGAMEDFLSDLVGMLEAKVPTTITLHIPTDAWISILFDIIEGDTKYQIAPGEEAFLDLLFACDDYVDDDEDDMTEDQLDKLTDLMNELREALEDGDDDEQD